MSQFFDYDPLTGVTEYFDWDDDKRQAVITKVQDIQPVLDYCKTLRNAEDYSKQGIKESWWRYALIPPVVQLELRKKGLDIHNLDPANQRKVYAEIDRNYPYLKTTTGKHR